MKNKDVVILKKILNYCMQIKEACDMFGNDYSQFVNNSAVEFWKDGLEYSRRFSKFHNE